MEYLYELKEKLCKELEEYAQKSNMNAGDLEMVQLCQRLQLCQPWQALCPRPLQPGRRLLP